jgi:predicted nucleic acid-binding protein
VARGLTFDTGLLIAAEKRSPVFHAIWDESVVRRARRTVPMPVLAQVWRKDAVMIARVLKACTVEALTERRAKEIGALLGESRTSDVVDASVALGAVERGDAIVTSDPDDMLRLLDALGAELPIVTV